MHRVVLNRHRKRDASAAGEREDDSREVVKFVERIWNLGVSSCYGNDRTARTNWKSRELMMMLRQVMIGVSDEWCQPQVRKAT